MTQLSDIQVFIEKSRQAATADVLYNLLNDISGEMGFDHFALLHHVDLRPFSSSDDRVVTSDFIALSNYPQFWIDKYLSGEIVNFDPVLLASQRTNVGFSWQKIPEMINMTKHHRDILETGRREGIVDGFTVPANVPGELNGSCNFAVRTGRSTPMVNFSMAQLVGSFAFEAARSLVARLRGLDETAPVQLTERQIECIVLVARGKTDWEIGQILGISEETAKRHISDARARYDVTKRVQVVLRALFDGLVPLSELIA
jgi:LuxR family transcriptional regulator, quorum-sensing system regulator CciR